jgi:hypothetical protein
MTLVESVLAKLGAMIDRAHLFSFKKPATMGAKSVIIRDLRPVGDTAMEAGHLLELWCVLDEEHAPLTAGSRIRFDILEEDFLLTGGLDDQVISLLGTDALPPESGFATEPRETVYHQLDPGVDVATYLEEYRRTFSRAPFPPFDTTILVLVEGGVEDGRPAGTRRSHVITWWRAKQVEDLDSESEMYFVADIDGVIRAGSPVLRTRAAVPGVAVRVIGNVVDAEPFDAATPEPLPDVPVSLGGRRALSGRDGDFVLDARLPAGEHRLECSRPGIDPLAVTVRVSLDAAGHATVKIVDAAGVNLYSATTIAPATEDTVITAPLGKALAVRVHKLRGTVLWPDSRPGGEEDVGKVANYVPMPADHLGTPLAERRVYVLPIPPGGSLTPHRPTTTRAWEALKAQPGVLVSARPGAPAAEQRTDFDGRFEVKYVDFSAGSRFLLWVERFDPQSLADVTTQAPDHVVRTEQRELIELHEEALAAHGNAGDLLRRNRNLIAVERNLLRDAVSWGVDAMRVLDRAGVRTLVRPDRQLRANFDDGELAAGSGEAHAVPASRLVDNLIIQVLPLAPVDEAADLQGAAARRLRVSLEQAASTACPDGADLGEVRWVLDAGRLDRALNLDLGTLEATKDAVSLADAALVSIDAGNPVAASRRLDATVVPVLGAIVPKLPALAEKRIYLGPGHGLWPKVGSANSANAADWQSNRGGWQLNAGEDEIDALQSAEINRIVAMAGMRVTRSREIENFAARGVANPAANVWQPQAGDFPRLWQQNAVYYLGVTGHPVVTGNAIWNSPGGPGGNKDKDGANARLAHLVAEARARPFDVVHFTHTNADVGNQHGTLMEYLNIDLADNNAGEGNPLGIGFATRLRDRVVARCHVAKNRGGVRSMLEVAANVTDQDLVATNDHFELQVPGDDPVQRRRVRQVVGAAPAGANWVHNTFAWKFPVVVSELLFHDFADDARLLGRAWFRRLAAEAMSQAIQDQVRDVTAAITADQARAVLTGMFGTTPPVAALPGGAAVQTAADLTNAVAAVGAANPAVAVAGASVANLVDAAVASARSYTRRNLVDALVAELRTIAGYAAADDLAATTAAVFHAGGVLARPGEPPTRGEAGAWACLAVGLTPASLATAEAHPIGAANLPLVRAAAGRASAYFPRAEGVALASALHALAPADIYRVADASFADAAWRRLSRVGKPNGYEVDTGTPVSLAVDTDGFPWQGAATDVSFVVAGGGKQKTLACATRQPRRLVSGVWFVDWPPTEKPIAATVTVRVRHSTAGWRVLGTRSVELRVVDPFAVRSQP